MGISVSRVGGAAQIKAMKQVAGTLRLDLASYREKQAFAQFGSDLDATTQYQLNHGAHMMEMLKQGRYAALDVADQVISIYAAKEDFIDDIDLDHVTLFRDGLARFMAERYPQVRAALLNGKIDDALGEKIKQGLSSYKSEFLVEHPNRAKAVDVEEMAEGTVDRDAEISGKAQE